MKWAWDKIQVHIKWVRDHLDLEVLYQGEQVKEVKNPDSLDQEVLEIKEDLEIKEYLEIKEDLAIKEDLVKLVGEDCAPWGLIKECSIKNSMKRKL